MDVSYIIVVNTLAGSKRHFKNMIWLLSKNSKRALKPILIFGLLLASFSAAATYAEKPYLTKQVLFEEKTDGFSLSWGEEYTSAAEPLIFGDEEEMGLGVRMATPLTEKATGRIRSNRGLETAKTTWGQEAEWCDYSGTTEGFHAGIAIFAHPDNFRSSWWHNRNYGLMVANAFGREAMKQGDRSAVAVGTSESLRMRYGIYFHSREEQVNPELLDQIYEEKMLNL